MKTYDKKLKELLRQVPDDILIEEIERRGLQDEIAAKMSDEQLADYIDL